MLSLGTRCCTADVYSNAEIGIRLFTSTSNRRCAMSCKLFRLLSKYETSKDGRACRIPRTFIPTLKQFIYIYIYTYMYIYIYIHIYIHIHTHTHIHEYIYIYIYIYIYKYVNPAAYFNIEISLRSLLDLCVSSLRWGHASLLCVVPMLTDDPRR